MQARLNRIATKSFWSIPRCSVCCRSGNIDCGGLAYVVIRYGNFGVIPSREDGEESPASEK